MAVDPDCLSSGQHIFEIQSSAVGPSGKLALSEELLLQRPSGDLFGLSQNAGMGWKPEESGRDQYLILSTQGGLRSPDGSPEALGYHTGHWEIVLQVAEAARIFRESGVIPFAGYCSDPCDGRTQGTEGMFDSLPYRNDAAIVLRRLARSLPLRRGVLGIATCDKGLPAMLMALAGLRDLPVAVVPGGVTLPPVAGEDAGKIQTIGVRYSHGLISLAEASELGCRACATPGGGCQFLGTAATAQVVAEALGLAPMHSALAPSGQPVWLDSAARAAQSLLRMSAKGVRSRDILCDQALHNAMVVHAAFGGSTNLLLHIPAIAHAAGLRRPTVEDWISVNKAVPRLVDALPNGPRNHPTVRVFLAGGVPEVMLHLRDAGLLHTNVQTVNGCSLGESLAIWEQSERRQRFKQILAKLDNITDSEVILSPGKAREAGLKSTVVFPRGNLAPEGSVVKATAIDPSVLDQRGVYKIVGPAKVFVRERAAVEALKTGKIQAGDVMVLVGAGPRGTGMEETYQVTSALRHLPFGRDVALVTDARFSGVSTGACIGHVGPEGLAGGPLGKLRDGDLVRIAIDCEQLIGTLDFVGSLENPLSPEQGAQILVQRSPREDMSPEKNLPQDTVLWSILQSVSGGTWGGCVYDVGALDELLKRS